MKNQYTVVRNGVKYIVEVQINMEELITIMVNNAARNPSGKASMLHGVIKAKVVK